MMGDGGFVHAPDGSADLVGNHRKDAFVFLAVVLNELLSQRLGLTVEASMATEGHRGWGWEFICPNGGHLVAGGAFLPDTDGNAPGIDEEVKLDTSQKTHPIKPLHA
jgi:hypothetical protein